MFAYPEQQTAPLIYIILSSTLTYCDMLFFGLCKRSDLEMNISDFLSPIRSKIY